MAGWAALLGERVHAQDERCRLTLGQADLVRARGVRLAAVAAHVDELGASLRPQRLPLPGDPLDAGRGVFIAELAMALAGPSAPLLVDVGFASGRVDEEQVDGAPIDDVSASDDRVHAAVTSCCSGWLSRASPASTQRRGPTGGSGCGTPLPATDGHGCHGWESLTALGYPSRSHEAWTALVATERAVAARAPYPATLDVESYYANLPDSLLELHASWQGDRSDRPAILD